APTSGSRRASPPGDPQGATVPAVARRAGRVRRAREQSPLGDRLEVMPGDPQGATVPAVALFPLSRDELVECAALVRATAARQLDRLIIPDHPLDILAQQIVAAAAGDEWDEEALYELLHGAYPYRELTRQDFDAVVQMLAEGF